MSIENRARRARVDLQRQIAERAVPRFRDKSHDRSKVLLAVALAVFMLAVLVAVPWSLRRSSTEDRAASTTSPADPGPALIDRPDVLSPDSWRGARTTNEGLMIVLSGGPALDGTDPCTVDYVASVEETETEVRVTVSGRSPEARETYSCQGKSYPRELQITLSAPLGERRLIETQFDTEHPVFDTASLLSPQPLPDGWTRLYEGPGPDHVNSWSQAWGPAESPTSAGLCTSSPEMLRLTQGPKDIGKAYPATGAAPAGQYEVGGRKATLYEGPGTTLLIWSADASGYVLETSPKCDGGAQDTADALLTFANSLH